MKKESNVVNLSQFQNSNLEINYPDREGKKQSVIIQRISARITFMLKGNKEILLAIVDLYNRCKKEVIGENGEKKVIIDYPIFQFELCNFISENYDFIMKLITVMLQTHIGAWVTFNWVETNTSENEKLSLVTVILQSAFPSNENETYVKNMTKPKSRKKKA